MNHRTLGLLATAAFLNMAAAQTTVPVQTPVSTTPVSTQTPATQIPTTPTPARSATSATPVAAPVAAPATRTRTIPVANYVALGVFYYDQGNYDSAYVAFRAASEQNPGNAEALLGLGRTQTKLRLFSASVDTLKKLVALDPRNISGFVALAQAYQAQYVGISDRAAAGVTGNLDEALKVLAAAETVARSSGGAATGGAAAGGTASNGTAASTTNVNLSKVYNERGYVYRLKGDSAQAIAAFKTASGLNPDNGVILYNLGDMYYAGGNLTAAIDSLQQAVVADPRDAYSRAYYAKLLALSGNTTAARPEAAQAAKLAPDNAYAVGQYGVVSYLAHDSATASAQLQAALKLDPLRYPEFYYYTGRLELDQGFLQAARGDLTKAAALASTNAEYLYYLGLSYERSQGTTTADRSKALENYQKALTLNPSYKLAQDGMSRVR